VDWEVIGVAGSSDQDEVGGEGSDARQAPEGGQGVVGWGRSGLRGVQVPGQSSLGETAQVFGLASEQAGEGLQVGEAVGGWEGVENLAVDDHGLPQFLGHAGLDRCRLGDTHPVADQRPRRGLIWRPEQHRAQARVSALEAADDRIRLADAPEASAVDVEGEDPRHLIGHRPSGGGTHELSDDTLAVLADTNPDRGP